MDIKKYYIPLETIHGNPVNAALTFCVDDIENTINVVRDFSDSICTLDKKNKTLTEIEQEKIDRLGLRPFNKKTGILGFSPKEDEEDEFLKDLNVVVACINGKLLPLLSSKEKITVYNTSNGVYILSDNTLHFFDEQNSGELKMIYNNFRIIESSSFDPSTNINASKPNLKIIKGKIIKANNKKSSNLKTIKNETGEDICDNN